jgi:hypothetical protein
LAENTLFLAILSHLMGLIITFQKRN